MPFESGIFKTFTCTTTHNDISWKLNQNRFVCMNSPHTFTLTGDGILHTAFSFLFFSSTSSYTVSHSDTHNMSFLSFLVIFPHSTSPNAGFYIQPDILFLSEHPKSQYVVANSDLSLSCAVQLRGLRLEEGGLNVPIVRWTVNNTYVSNVR